MSGTITTAAGDPDIFRVSQLIWAVAPQATVSILGMICTRCQKGRFFRWLNYAFGVEVLQASWPSPTSQRKAWRFWSSWPLQAPKRPMVTEANDFDIMWFISESHAAQNHAGASGKTGLDETRPVSTVMFLLQECFENSHPFSIALPRREPAVDGDSKFQFFANASFGNSTEAENSADFFPWVTQVRCQEAHCNQRGGNGAEFSACHGENWESTSTNWSLWLVSMHCGWQQVTHKCLGSFARN